MRVLIADDDRDITEIISFSLRRYGYQVLIASDGQQALELAERDHPDVVILDVMMPKIDGYEVCRRLRLASHIPIIMLTAKDEENDKVFGLDVGADDYLTKPFSHKELLARIRAVLRRAQNDLPAITPPLLRVGKLILDASRHIVTSDERPIDLTPTEFQLLRCLMVNQDRVVSHDSLLSYAWGANFDGETEMLKVHIRHLREKLENDPSSPELIVTVRGVGYRLVAGATEAEQRDK
jgi:DNA-binding response OmpR family regulator